jgi:hypothetical protein
MRMEFPYLRFRDRYLPMIPVSLITQERVETIAVLDSGAALSMFKPSIAEQLGMDLESGECIQAEGVSGKVSVYLHEIDMELEGKRFRSVVGFSTEYPASVNIIGR